MRDIRDQGARVLGSMFMIMGNMGSSLARHRRSSTPEFKAKIVERCQRGDRSIGQVAKDYDLTETGMRERAKQADRDAGIRDDGLTNAEREELAALSRENRRLREDVDTLKRATTHFTSMWHMRRFACGSRHSLRCVTSDKEAFVDLACQSMCERRH